MGYYVVVYRRRNVHGGVRGCLVEAEVELREVGMIEEKDIQKRKRSDEKVFGKKGHEHFLGKFIFVCRQCR